MKNIYFLFIPIILLWGIQLNAQVSVTTDGSSAHPSSMLDVKSTVRGFLMPRMTTVEMNAIGSPAPGLMVYNTTDNTYYYYNGTVWSTLTASYGWTILGNAGTVSGTNFIGTSDAQDLDMRTNNVIHTRISQKGQIETLNTGYSVFIGEQAGENDNLDGNYNVFVGYQAGFSNTTGVYNTASGVHALYSNTTGTLNTANGVFAIASNTTGANNTANGVYALYSNTTGHFNTANGVQALYSNTTGNYNTANGYQALNFSTTGNDNTANGVLTLYANTTGSSNTANGVCALRSNSTGYSNTVSGAYAMYANSTGYYNTANGTSALNFNTTGYQNTADGVNALYSTTTGYSNTATGYQSLYSNTTGNYNTGLGLNANVSAGDLTNATAIGYGSIVNESNRVIIGNSDVDYIGGYSAWQNLSDGRFKTNIQDNVPGLAFINSLKPVSYQLNTQKLDEHLMVNMPDSIRYERAKNMDYSKSGSIVHTGFVAQDVEKICRELNYDFDGLYVPEPDNPTDHYSLAYAQFVVPLVKAVQEQQAMIEKQQQAIEKLQFEIESLKTK